MILKHPYCGSSSSFRSREEILNRSPIMTHVLSISRSQIKDIILDERAFARMSKQCVDGRAEIWRLGCLEETMGENWVAATYLCAFNVCCGTIAKVLSLV